MEGESLKRGKILRIDLIDEIQFMMRQQIIMINTKS